MTVQRVSSSGRMEFDFKQMTPSDAHATGSWRYPEPYSFYNLDADEDDLVEFMNEENWPDAHFSAADGEGELVGFFIFHREESTATVGLGLRPDLTGRGLGTAFVAAGLDFGAERWGIEQYRLAVAAFNVRAINVYRRLPSCIRDSVLP